MGAHLRSLLANVIAMPVEPTKMPVARNEREINEQQAASAERFSKLGNADAPALQPDEVRKASDNVVWHDLSMRCGEKLPPESAWTTRGVELFVKSQYRGFHGEQHQWKYTITFTNGGRDTVQMLSRHWVFTDANGKAHEVKGPGARGVTPVLGPGDSWSYESGASLPTPVGSMHGSFQFDTLKSISGETPSAFSARVARLALSSVDKSERPPCGAWSESAARLMPPTSVHATRRVIVGANAQYNERMSNPAKGIYRFVYDCQVRKAFHRLPSPSIAFHCLPSLPFASSTTARLTTRATAR